MLYSIGCLWAIATSDVTPNGGFSKGNPWKFQGNLGWKSYSLAKWMSYPGIQSPSFFARRCGPGSVTSTIDNVEASPPLPSRGTQKTEKQIHRIHVWYIFIYLYSVDFYGKCNVNIYQHLQVGVPKWFRLTGVNSPSLRVALAPLWRYRYIIRWIFMVNVM